MAVKKNNAHVQMVTDEIEKLIIKGKTFMDIVVYCEQKHNITSRNSVWQYISRAKKQITETNKTEIEELREIQNKRLNDLYQKAYNSKSLKTGKRYTDVKECRELIETISKINGLHANNNNNVTIHVEKPEQLIIEGIEPKCEKITDS